MTFLGQIRICRVNTFDNPQVLMAAYNFGWFCVLKILSFQYLHGIAEKTEDRVSRGQRVIPRSGCAVVPVPEDGPVPAVSVPGGPVPAVSVPEDGLVVARGTRYSLTIRHVPNTSKLKIKLGK